MASSEEIFQEAVALPVDARADLIEKLALDLSEQDRATLAMNLLESLPPVLSDEDGGIAEALRRDAEMDKDPSQGISLTELESQIRNRQ